MLHHAAAWSHAGEVMGIEVLDHLVLAETATSASARTGQLALTARSRAAAVGARRHAIRHDPAFMVADRWPDTRGMKLLYFDCFSGASGDMMLGALLDAGLPLEDAAPGARAASRIGGYELRAERVLRAGVSATKFRLIERAGEDASAGLQPARHAHVHDHGTTPCTTHGTRTHDHRTSHAHHARDSCRPLARHRTRIRTAACLRSTR